VKSENAKCAGADWDGEIRASPQVVVTRQKYLLPLCLPSRPVPGYVASKMQVQSIIRSGGLQVTVLSHVDCVCLISRYIYAWYYSANYTNSVILFWGSEFITYNGRGRAANVAVVVVGPLLARIKGVGVAGLESMNWVREWFWWWTVLFESYWRLHSCVWSDWQPCFTVASDESERCYRFRRR
jgi:hypothetical protein